jgi:hypothetical protein
MISTGPRSSSKNIIRRPASHNLPEIHQYKVDSPPPEYAVAFDTWLEEVITLGREDALLNYCPSINGPFSDERRSPRVSVCGVRRVRLDENPCAALLIEKTAHF